MKFYSKFISSKNFLLIFSLFFLLFSTIFWQAKINNERQIFYEPDDHFHYLVKATNNIYCKDHQCYEKNLFIDAEKNDLSDLDKFLIPRQIHRLIYSYHPLYTFVLEKISNDKNIFEVQKKFHLFLGVIIALLIIIYLKQFIKKEIIFLISLMLSSHLYYNFYGINLSIPWTISCLLGSIGVFYQFKSKTISCFLIFISAVTHKVGLIFFPLTIITYFIFFLTENKISLEYIYGLIKKNIVYVIISFFIFIAAHKITYSPYDLKSLSLTNLYSFDYNFFNIIKGVFKNIKHFIKALFSLTYFNPILGIFFISSFFIKFDKNIKILKIFTIFLVFLMVLYFNPSGGDYFTVGVRAWLIFIVNYLILSILALFKLAKKYQKINFLKLFFLVFMPIFFYIGISQNSYFAERLSSRHNNYYDIDNLRSIKKLINPEKKIFFDLDERGYYYSLANGFINFDTYYNYSIPYSKNNIKFDYLVIDNPLQDSNESDLILKENTLIKFDNINIDYKLILFSNGYEKIYLNNKIFYLVRGKNILNLNENFINIKKNDKNRVSIIGLIQDDKQTTNWPWGSNINFNFETTNQESNKFSILSKKNIKKSHIFNFLDMQKNISKKFPENCQKEIISDKDSLIFFKLDC